jgi:hypothetical protein
MIRRWGQRGEPESEHAADPDAEDRPEHSLAELVLSMRESAAPRSGCSTFMNIYSLEFSYADSGVTERIWHTNRRALERYAQELRQQNYEVRGVQRYELPTPLTESRVVAFLNAHCANFPPTAESAGLRHHDSPELGSS